MCRDNILWPDIGSCLAQRQIYNYIPELQVWGILRIESLFNDGLETGC